MKITGNTILVTGGTSGIGRAMAEALHDRGNRVLVTGRRQALLDEITAQRPGLAGFSLDVNDADSLSRLRAHLREYYPELNVVMANAGISRTEDLTSDDWTADDAEAVVQTNILGVLRVTETVLPLLKANADSTLLVTSSALAFVPRSDFPAYCASKAFLHSWLQSLRHQLRAWPIEILELCPPYVQTELTGAHQASDQRAMPLTAFVTEALQKLQAGDTPHGEVLLDRDLGRRWAERDGRYQSVFAMLNPA
jgi:uncharacterized oxidoreductase